MTTETATEPRDRPALGRDWRLVWASSAMSFLGDGAFAAALPLLAARMTRDPRLIAGLTVCGTLPWLLFSLQAGAIADRRDGRRLLLGAQAAQGAVIAVIAGLATAGAGGIPALYVLAFALGVAAAQAKSAAQALLPAVVPADLLVTANGRLFTGQSVAGEFAGPMLGGALFAVAPASPFWSGTAAFAAAALLAARLATRTVPAAAPAGRRLRSDIAEGLAWLARHRLLRTTTTLTAVANFGNLMATSTLVLLVGERAYGPVLSAAAVGGIAGGLASRRVIARFGGRAVVTGTVLTTPLGLLAVGLAGGSPLAVGALTAVGAACASLWNVAVVSLRQRLVPARMQARVAGVGTMVSWGVQPLGALAGGMAAARFGLPAPWIIGGAVRLLSALVCLPALRAWE